MSQTNESLERAIDAVGGVVAAAYLLKKSTATIYLWKKAGRVFDALDAVKFARLARDNGCQVSIEALAGAELADGPDGNGGESIDTVQTGGRMRTRTACLPISAGITARLKHAA